jgi:hypothetical protein
LNKRQTWRKDAGAFSRLQAYSYGPYWHLPPKGDRHFNIRLSRNTCIALSISLIIHAIVIFLAFPELINNASSSKPQAISVTLSSPEPHTQPSPTPKVSASEKKSRPKTKSPEVMTANSQETSKEQTPPPAKMPENTQNIQQPVDMMALVNANRQRRQAQENNAYRENSAAVAKERGDQQEDARDALIKKNLAQEGTNGIFYIKEIQLRHAQFAFKGWKNNINQARLEVIDVHANPNETIERAIVKKMILIIRREYSGDFNWESHLLGRVVVLSAKLEDNAELEEFLIREFFSPGAKYGGRQ